MEQTVYVHYITVYRVLLSVFPHCRSLPLVAENLKLQLIILYSSQISTMIWDDWRLVETIEMSSACTGELAFKSCKRAPCLESSSSLIRSFTNTKYSLVDKTFRCRTRRCSVNHSDNVPSHSRGGSRGVAPAARPPKIGKNKICWRKIVIFQTKYLKNFRASLRSVQFF